MSKIWSEDDRVWLTLERLAAVLSEDGLFPSLLDAVTHALS